MTKAVLLFVVGLVLLIKGGDFFVDGATGIAHRLHIPELIIGATVVSIGTTLPEVMVSSGSAIKGYSEMSYGNAIGSVICNTALIAAITIAIKPSKIERDELKIPVAFFFASALFYSCTAYFLGKFTRQVGIVLLMIFILYIFVCVSKAKEESDVTKKLIESEVKEEPKGKKESLLYNVILLVAGAAFIAIGADLLVDNGTIIAEEMGVPQSVIALTFVALGTSLPELVTAIISLAKGHGSLSLGNIIGANLFNLVLVCGLSVTLKPFSLPAGKTLFGYNSSLVLDIPVMLAVMMILTLPALLKGKLSRFQGISLLVIYTSFIAFQFAM